MSERLNKARNESKEAYKKLQRQLQNACEGLEHLMHLQEQAMACLMWADQQQKQSHAQLIETETEWKDTELEAQAREIYNRARELTTNITRRINQPGETADHQRMLAATDSYCRAISKEVKCMKDILMDDHLGSLASKLKVLSTQLEANKASILDASNHVQANASLADSERAQASSLSKPDAAHVIVIDSDQERKLDSSSDEAELEDILESDPPQKKTAAGQEELESGALEASSWDDSENDGHPIFQHCQLDSSDEQMIAKPKPCAPLSKIILGRKVADPRHRSLSETAFERSPTPDKLARPNGRDGERSVQTMATTTISRDSAASRSPRGFVGDPQRVSVPSTQRHTAIESADFESEDLLDVKTADGCGLEIDEAKNKSSAKRRKSSPVNAVDQDLSTSNGEAEASANWLLTTQSMKKRRTHRSDPLQDLQRLKPTTQLEDAVVDLT